MLSCLGLLSASQAQAATQSITVDMGIVNLVAGTAKQEITYQVPSNCSGTTVEIKKGSGGSITIQHGGQKCQSGATITVPVVAGTDLDLTLESGVIKVADPKSAVKDYSNIQLKVDAGVINSDVVKTSRTSDYAGAEGKVKNRNGNGSTLNLKAKSGVINF